jgi:predicted methyltransferase MtxX (methanogen marker protein 4)
MSSDDGGTNSYPKLEIRGGPLARRIIPTINGEPIPKATRLTLVIDPRDAVRAIYEQIVEVDVEVELVKAQDGGPASHVIVREKDVEGRDNLNWRLAEAVADTTWQALADCAKQLELKAKQEARLLET